MKKIFVVLAILTIGILLVAGCTSQPAAPVATPAPTVVPTPVVTVPPTPVPTKEVVVVKIATPTPTLTPTPTPTPVPTYTITFTDHLTITPSATATVKVGTKVIWVSMDPYKPHSIQANDVQMAQYFGGMNPIAVPYVNSPTGLITADSGIGKSPLGTPYSPLEITFDKVGSYDYTTGPFQPQEQGKIIVTA
jgi:plastocyanin